MYLPLSEQHGSSNRLQQTKMEQGTKPKIKTDRLFQSAWIGKMSGVPFQGYDMLRLTGLIFWLMSSDVAGPLQKRARRCGQPAWGVCNQWLYESWASFRSAADASGRGYTIHVLGKCTSCGPGCALGDRACCGLKDAALPPVAHVAGRTFAFIFLSSL